LNEGVSRRHGAALLLAALAVPPARAEAPELRTLVGEPLLALAAHPAIGPRLRRMAAGRQRVVSDAVRAPGTPLALAGHWLHGTGANDEARILLAFEWRTETLALMLFEAARPSLFVPPRVAPWPGALRPAVLAFAPELGGRMRFDQSP